MARMTVAARFEIEYLQYLKPDGTLAGDLPPAVPDANALLPLFKRMLFVRTFDSKAIALQRTGKLGTYAACLGHEATHIGIGASMQPEDVFAPSYREYGAQFDARGEAARRPDVLGRRRTRQRFRDPAQGLSRGACRSPPSA
jgi:pyruvate dehydrogenase E1 component alpha subunit